MDPTLARDGWELESAEERHQAAPTFGIPSAEERSSLVVGQKVKLLFLLAVPGRDGVVQCEKMWVMITEVVEGSYAGILESCPATSNAIEEGARVAFRPEHVSAVLIPKADPRHPHYGR